MFNVGGNNKKNTNNSKVDENIKSNENINADDGIEILDSNNIQSTKVEESEIKNLDVQNFDKEKDDELAKQSQEIQSLKTKNAIKNFCIAILSIFTICFFATIVIAFLLFNGKLLRTYNQFFNHNTTSEIGGSISSPSEINSTVIDEKRIASKIAYIDSMLKAFYYYPIDDKKVENSLFKGMVDGIEDKYAAYMPPQELSEFIEDSDGEYYGIGATVAQNPETGDYLVIEIAEGSPAEKYGIKKGDVFYTINGQNIEGLALDELVSLVKGPENTSVKIGMFRYNDKKVHEIEVIRGKVEQKTITAEMFSDDTGLLKITQFEGVTASQFEKAIEGLKENGMKKLIIDLRGNPGGNLDTVLSMLDYLLPDRIGKYTNNSVDFLPGETLLVYMRDRKEIVDQYYCDDKHSCNFPIAILTNQSSASASELFSQCLKDYGYAVTVGERTFGKGVVQNMIAIDDGSAVKFTVSEYFSPSSYAIQDKGVMPDFPINTEGKILEYINHTSAKVVDKYTMSDELSKILESKKQKEAESENSVELETEKEENEDSYVEEEIVDSSIEVSIATASIIASSSNIDKNISIASDSEIHYYEKLKPSDKYDSLLKDEKRQMENDNYMQIYEAEQEASGEDYQLYKAFDVLYYKFGNFSKDIIQ